MIAWAKKHWILLAVATGGAFLLYYLYTNYSASSSVAAPADTSSYSYPSLTGGGSAYGAAAPSNVTPLNNVLTPGDAPNATAVTPGGAVLQPNASASGVPTYSNQTQQFATNTPAPGTSPIDNTALAATVASSSTPLSTAAITALPGGSFGVSSPQSLALTKGVEQGNPDVVAVQQAYDKAFAAANPADATFYAQNSESPFLIMQAQQQQGGQAQPLPGTTYAGGPMLPSVGSLLPNGVAPPAAAPAPYTGATQAQQLAILQSEGITPAASLTGGSIPPATPVNGGVVAAPQINPTVSPGFSPTRPVTYVNPTPPPPAIVPPRHLRPNG